MSPASGARVLVVDDEPAILRVVQTNLTGHDFRVETADTGRAALEAHSRFHPDLVLLDLGLPDMDGLEVIREIRSNSSTPIVVLSVRGAERDKVQALDLGADDYLTKPFAFAAGSCFPCPSLTLPSLPLVSLKRTAWQHLGRGKFACGPTDAATQNSTLARHSARRR